MSVVISNCDLICRAQSNNSPAKYLFTFSKTKRFDKTYVPQVNPNISYDINRDFIKQPFNCKTKTTFGVSRPDLFFSKENLSKPTPIHYTLPTSFTTVRSKTQNLT